MLSRSPRFVIRQDCGTVESGVTFDWSEQVGHIWQDWNRTFGLGEKDHIKLRPALSRLQSFGYVSEAQTNFVKDGSLARQAFGLLLEGKKFYERLGKVTV